MADPVLVLYVLQVILMWMFSRRFDQIDTPEFKELKDHAQLLTTACWMGLFAVMTFIARDYVGIPCWLYELEVLTSPAFVAFPSLIVAFVLVCKMNSGYLQSSSVGHRSRALNCVSHILPSGSAVSHRTWAIMAGVITVHLAAFGVVIFMKGWETGGNSLLNECQLSSNELWGIVAMFVLYLILFVTCIVMLGISVPPVYRLAAMYIRIITAWNFLTLSLFLLFNLHEAAGNLWSKYVFDPEVFGILFYFGQVMITLGFTQVYDFWLNGGTVFGKKIWVRNGATKKVVRESPADEESKFRAIAELGFFDGSIKKQMKRVLDLNTTHEADYNCVYAGLTAIVLSRARLDNHWPAKILFDTLDVLTASDISDLDTNVMVKLTSKQSESLKKIGAALNIQSIKNQANLMTISRADRHEILVELGPFIGKAALMYIHQGFTDRGVVGLWNDEDTDPEQPEGDKGKLLTEKQRMGIETE
jgi:hypothetical protein